MSNTPRLRCAVYTRKSTEEGLEQDFNSLDAQYEACAAFVASQVGLGWRLVSERYDDGGISGGTMERPALQRLLQDIRDRKVDVVVVYKIDRLTRLLTDFSKIVEVFDQSGASFVSVTQQFNTTTSMGRLTLNVLLSFAQFEREVTAERIRDKIAASKRKGMWMGGAVSLGYRVQNRKLVINEAEAETVRWIFDRYLELKSVRALVDEIAARRLTHASPKATLDGEVRYRAYSRGNIYHLLSSPIYIGKVRHRGQVYDGEHQPIVEEDVFAAVQQLLKNQAPCRRQAINSDDVHLLTGMLFDEAGDRLRSVHANKLGVRYRYYVSKSLADGRKKDDRGWRLPTREIEATVEQQLNLLLHNASQLTDWIREFAPNSDLTNAFDQAKQRWQAYEKAEPLAKRKTLGSIMHRIDLKPGELCITVDRAAVVAMVVDAASRDQLGPDFEVTTTIRCPMSLRRRGVELRMVVDTVNAPPRAPDANLVDLVLRAHRYLARLTANDGIMLSDVAAAEGVDPSEVSRLLPLAFLSPKLVDQILTGTQPVALTGQRLSRLADLPTYWLDQHRLFAAA